MAFLRWPRVVEWHQVASGATPGRHGSDEITLYDALGVASEDVAAAAHVYARAVEVGRGVELPIPGRL